MCQKRARCYFHSALWEFHPTPLALLKRWTFTRHPSHIGFLQHPPWRVEWLAYHDNRIYRVFMQADPVEEANEDVKLLL